MKKIINTILLLVVLTVWVFILYRIFNNQTIPNNESQNTYVSNVSHYISKDTFTMTQSYNDPFKIEKTSIKRTNVKPVTNVSQNRPVQNKRIKNFIPHSNPNVFKNNLLKHCQYKGFVKNLNATNSLGLFLFNGKLHRKQPNEIINTEYRVLQIFRDSAWIKIINDGQKITIPKS